MRRSKIISIVHPVVEAVEFAALALSLLILAMAFWSVLFLDGHLLGGLTK